MKNNAEVHRRTVIKGRCRRRRARAPSVRTRWDRDVSRLLTKKPHGILPAARPPVSRVFWSTGCTKPKTDSMGGDVQTPGTVTAKRVCLATMGTIVAHGCESIACDTRRRSTGPGALCSTRHLACDWRWRCAGTVLSRVSRAEGPKGNVGARGHRQTDNA
jgi:hypothetical protein